MRDERLDLFRRYFNVLLLFVFACRGLVPKIGTKTGSLLKNPIDTAIYKGHNKVLLLPVIPDDFLLPRSHLYATQ